MDTRRVDSTEEAIGDLSGHRFEVGCKGNVEFDTAMRESFYEYDVRGAGLRRFPALRRIAQCRIGSNLSAFWGCKTRSTTVRECTARELDLDSGSHRLQPSFEFGMDNSEPGPEYKVRALKGYMSLRHGRGTNNYPYLSP